MSNTLQMDLDIDRYMGTWYEIAKLPTPFQTGCQRSVAVYQKLSYVKGNKTANQDFHEEFSECRLAEAPILFSVLNKCLDANGNVIRTINGVGEIKDKNNPAVINVSFENVDEPESSAGNYLVHYTNYKYAIVGSPDKSTLFLLSRSPTISKSLYDAFKVVIRNFGYPTENLVVNSGAVGTPHRPDTNIYKSTSETSYDILWWILFIIIIPLFLLIAFMSP